MFDIFPIEGGVCAPDGFYADGVKAGLKKDQYDVAFLRSDVSCDVGAVFTTNKFCAAPIIHAKSKINQKIDGVLINAKNANAMTGNEGIEDLEEILKEIPYNFLMSSTGVIGVRLPKEKIINAIKQFNYENKNPNNASSAIMTTDSFSKTISYEINTQNGTFKIGAMAKGAGMIAPSLATMLCFVTTDANIPKNEIQEILESLMDDSFNAISVDGDMSTNDTVFIFANKKSGVYDKIAFTQALKLVLHHLALLMVKDGEGAKKLCAFEVKNAKNYEDAKKAAKALSNSLLVKTALFGEDPNWGRIASTIGASQVECDSTKLSIQIGNIFVYDKKGIMDKDVEIKAANVLKKDEFKIICDLRVGDASYTAYGCDLGYEYVKINADYRT